MVPSVLPSSVQNLSRAQTLVAALQSAVPDLKDLFPLARSMTAPHVNRNGPDSTPWLRVQSPMDQVRFIGITPSSSYLRFRVWVYESFREQYERLLTQKYFTFGGVALRRGPATGNYSWERILEADGRPVLGYQALLPIDSWSDADVQGRTRDLVHQFCSFVVAAVEGGRSYEDLPSTTPDATEEQPWEADEQAILHIDGLELGASEREALTKIRIGQSWFKDQLIDRWKGCAVHGPAPHELLIASHIWPWAKCASARERWDVDNGLLLTPNLDKLFDKGFIGFSRKGYLLIGPKAEKRDLSRFGADKGKGLNRSVFVDTPRLQAYLARHRELHQISE